MNKETLKKTWFSIFRQAAIIILISILLGGLINQIRFDGLPIVGDWRLEPKQDIAQDAYGLISLEEAVHHFHSRTCIFLDARSPMLYKKGHIAGALNLPWEEVDKYFENVMAEVPKDVLLIVYCDGRDCSLSRDLALDLYFSGYNFVGVFENGWSLWNEENLPVEKNS